jgi:RNA polymerase sigma-70 factor (ECF subfamily)
MDIDLQACIDGHKQAWDAFVETASGIIFRAVERTTLHYGASRDHIDDYVQDVFVRLLKDDCKLLRSYDPQRAALSTWLTLVSRSVVLDRLRRRRHRTVPLTDVDQAAPEATEAPPMVPLDALTGQQRLVIRLLYERGLSVIEAANVMGVAPQTIRSAKHKAVLRLREVLPAGDPWLAGMNEGQDT